MSRRLIALLAPALLALAACAPATRVVLLPQEGVPTAAVTVQARQGQVVLAQPYAVAEVASSGSVDTAQTDAQQVEKRYGQLLSVQPAAEQRFTLLFMPGGAQLTPESSAELADVLARATERPGGEVIIIGHTDRVGSVESNDTLSLQRAQAVRQLVIDRGFDPNRVEAVGRGEREPVVQTADEVEEPKNRRAEIVVR
ncbi:OmpA family protein [Ottowia beijingensis]|uniref:OmpA family protein n=1 Tax=Ottowia beijingensis TaxID=1207057 RepID=A0A853IQS0_9BURK|nr:OmpA family protein [Ottowia beijingensis]NZA02816.1 OmpA family protein [Ottowia beijingensis]